jgi:hypothetical protein
VANKRWEARFMVLTIESVFMPSLEGSLHRKIKEVTMRERLDAYTTNDLPLSHTRLILQEKIMLEEGEVWGDGKVALAEMNKYGDLKNGVRVEVN